MMIDDHNAIISHTSETGTTHQVDAGEISRTAQADPQRGFSVSGPVFHPADGSASLRSQEGMVTASVSHDGFPAHELFLDVLVFIGSIPYRQEPLPSGFFLSLLASTADPSLSLRAERVNEP
jgi:hypothetical protein